MALKASKGMFRVLYGNTLASVRSCGASRLFAEDDRKGAEAFYQEQVENARLKSFGKQRAAYSQPGPNHGKPCLVLEGRRRFNDAWSILQQITGVARPGGIQSKRLKRKFYRNGKLKQS